MFERFTDEARRALFYARARTAERDGDAITNEDLLDGLLLAAPDAITRFAAADALLPRETAEEFIERAERGDTWGRHARKEIPFSPSAKLVLDRALQEANDLGHADLRPEHLLVGLLPDEGSEAWRMLHEAGVRLTAVRRALAEGTGTS